MVTLIVGGFLLYSGVIKPALSRDVATGSVEDMSSVNSQNEATDTKDRDAHQLYAYNLGMLLTSYRVTYGAYPVANAEGWQDFLETSGAKLADPYTGNLPVYTLSTPEQGEVQYISPGTCSAAGPTLESSNGNTFAYRAYVAGKIICYGNTSGYIE